MAADLRRVPWPLRHWPRLHPAFHDPRPDPSLHVCPCVVWMYSVRAWAAIVRDLLCRLDRAPSACDSCARDDVFVSVLPINDNEFKLRHFNKFSTFLHLVFVAVLPPFSLCIVRQAAAIRCFPTFPDQLPNSRPDWRPPLALRDSAVRLCADQNESTFESDAPQLMYLRVGIWGIFNKISTDNFSHLRNCSRYLAASANFSCWVHNWMTCSRISASALLLGACLDAASDNNFIASSTFFDANKTATRSESSATLFLNDAFASSNLTASPVSPAKRYVFRFSRTSGNQWFVRKSACLPLRARQCANTVLTRSLLPYCLMYSFSRPTALAFSFCFK